MNMSTSQEELKQLIENDWLCSVPGFITNLDADVNAICLYLGEEKIKNYISQRQKNEPGCPMFFIHPMQLAIAGHQILEINDVQDIQFNQQLKKKFADITLEDDKLSDLLAELYIAAILKHYKLRMNEATGVGSKDSDLYIPEIDIYVEVKNYEVGRTDFERHMQKDTQNLFQNGVDGQYMVDSKGTITTIGTTQGLRSFATAEFNPSKQLYGLIESADKKFKDGMNVVVVLFNNMYHQIGNVIDEWKANKGLTNNIDAMLVVGRSKSDTGSRDLYGIQLKDNAVVREFLKSNKFID